MSEVKRHGRIGDMVEATEGLLKLYPMMSVYVLASDFDRATAERDAAMERKDALWEENLKVRDMHAKQCCVFCNDRGNLLAVHAELKRRLTAAEERAVVLERVEARYHWLQKATPYRFKKIQDSSVTDGGDVLYFHADRFDASVDAALKPAEARQ